MIALAAIVIAIALVASVATSCATSNNGKPT